jgi:isopentenyl phosphate kinase
MYNLAEQIASYRKHTSMKIILGNGGGSFGHYYAEKYGLEKGISSEQGIRGLCKGKNGNAYLNMLLTKSLIDNGLNACSYAIDDVYWKAGDCDIEAPVDGWDRLFSYLDSGILPVVYGDILYDEERGCKIISTEQIFDALTKRITRDPDCGYQIEKIIYCTNCDGVEDLDGNVIPYISRSTFQQWEIFKRDVEGFDVTGGMYGKVKMSIDTNMQCPVQIINGNNPGYLYRALLGENMLGTLIWG